MDDGDGARAKGEDGREDVNNEHASLY